MKKILLTVALLIALLLSVMTSCADGGGNNEPVIDMTQASSTVAYAQLYAIVTHANEYLGRTIKMKGRFDVFEDESTGMIYYNCIITDETACCSQGLEFITKDNLKYPDDYPAPKSAITVTGVFETYLENGKTYYHLTDTVIEM